MFPSLRAEHNAKAEPNRNVAGGGCGSVLAVPLHEEGEGPSFYVCRRVGVSIAHIHMPNKKIKSLRIQIHSLSWLQLPEPSTIDGCLKTTGIHAPPALETRSLRPCGADGVFTPRCHFPRNKGHHPSLLMQANTWLEAQNAREETICLETAWGSGRPRVGNEPVSRHLP